MNLIERVGLDVFLPFVMAACPDVPETMAIGYLRQACIDFSQRSGLLRRTALIDQQRGVCDYPLWPERCESVVRVNEVCVEGCCYRGGRSGCCFDHGGARFTIDEGMLCIAGAQAQDKPDAIEVRFVVAPARDACVVDAILHDDWQEAIEDGALARLYLLPNTPFSSPPLAGVRSRSFADYIRRARIQVLKSDTGESIDARAPAFV